MTGSLSLKKFALFIVIFTWTIVSSIPMCADDNKSLYNELGNPFIQLYPPEISKSWSQSWKTLQDHRGILYFGTSDGLIEYDGNHWRKININNITGIRAIAKDKNGRIYLGGTNRIGYLKINAKGDKEYVSMRHRLQHKDRKFGKINDIKTHQNGTYFLTKNKIFYFNKDGVKVIESSFLEKLHTIENQLLVIQEKKGISILKDGEISFISGGREFGKEEYGIIYPLPFVKGKMLIYTSGKGFFVYDIAGWLSSGSKPAPPVKFPTEVDSYVSGNPYFKGCRIDENRYALFAMGRGIVVMDQQGRLVRLIGKNSGLQYLGINNIYPDNSGNLWVTANSGIAYIETSSPISHLDGNHGLEGISICVTRHKDELYVGNFLGVFYMPGHSSSTERTFLPLKTGEQCFAFFNKENLLLAAGEGVHYIKDGKTRKIHSGPTVLHFAATPKFPGYIFMGTTSGLQAMKVSASAEREHQFDFIDEEIFKNLKQDIIYKIHPDKAGNFWLTSVDAGLIHLRFPGIKNSANPWDIKRFTLTRYHTRQGLPRIFLNLVRFMKDRMLVVNNIGIYEPVRSRENGNHKEITGFKLLMARNDIPVNPNLRFNLQAFKKKKQAWINIDKVFGLLTVLTDGSVQWNPVPYSKMPDISDLLLDKDGTQWFCSSKGLFRYKPMIPKDYFPSYSTLIRSVTITGGEKIFNGSFYDHRVPEMKHYENSISFLFSSAFYEREGETVFSHILEGFEKKWKPWSGDTHADYTNLSEGSYRFRVKARNVFGNPGKEASYRFIIKPPWYRTVYAYFGYLLLCIMIFLGTMKMNSRRLSKTNLRLERLVSQRTRELNLQSRELMSQKKELQKEREIAEAANRSKSLFLARMSHEIRTPINGVMGFAEMMMDTKLDEEQSEYASTIVRSSESLLVLINDILDLSKIEAGKLTFEHIDFDLGVMAFDICYLIMPRLGSKPVEVLCRIGDDVPAFVKSDPGRLRQVLVNLMGNASKFTRKGEIELAINVIEVTEEQLKIKITVRDTGIGIPKEQQGAIFDQFRQAETSTTRKYGGSGLGLSICQQIAKLLHGDISLQSEEGKGSIFHFTAWVDKSSQKAPFIRDAKQLKGKRVLVADTNQNSLEILCNTLEKLQMETVAVTKNLDILPQLLAQPVDLCILDIKLADESGTGIASLIRSQEDTAISNLPLLAFSSATEKQIHLSRQLGFNGFLPKPVQTNKLVVMMKRLLDSKAEQINREPGGGKTAARYHLEKNTEQVSILLADDNAINRKLASAMLTRGGHKVETARNGREVVEIFCGDPSRFDLIFMDVNMPEMNGLEAVRTIRQKGFTEIPVIAVTADAMKEDRNRCIDAGMNDYISKPIKREIVFRMIHKWARPIPL